MKYMIRARYMLEGNFGGLHECILTHPGESRWGTEGDASAIELTDAEVVAAIIKYGRASITEQPDGTRLIDFHNDYD